MGYTAYCYVKARREEQELPYTCEPYKIAEFRAEQSTVIALSCVDISTMFDLMSTGIDPITAMECSAPNLSLVPKVDTITIKAPLINEELSLLDMTSDHVTMNNIEIT